MGCLCSGGDDQLVRLRGDVTRLSDELATCREALSAKDKELSMTIGNLTAIQLNFQNREVRVHVSHALISFSRCKSVLILFLCFHNRRSSRRARRKSRSACTPSRRSTSC